MLLILFGRLPEVKLGPQTRACAVLFVYVVAVETSILEVLAPFASTALLQLLHIGLLVSFGFPCSFALGVDRYVFFRADTDTDYYRSSRPITDILNRYTCLV